ncbi:MAG: alpha/beta hydrolase [Rhodobacteraceae bacterium]|nr:alpha/beta hydrolase [Paracoccaceae bacterium]
MTNPLIAARDAFARHTPETRVSLLGRDWGVIDRPPASSETRPDEALTLLLIPGTLGRADIFWQQIAALTEMRVLAVSYPQSGGIAEWVADLAGLLDQRGVGQTAVLGSSLGGYLAQAFAATHPARVSHLFAANTLSSVEGIATRPPYSLDLWQAPIDLVRGGFRAAMESWGQSHPDQADLVGFLLAESAGRIPDGEMRARLAALKDAPALGTDPRPVEHTTVIETEDDPLIPPPMRAAVRARYPGAAAFRFAWGGHFPYILRPDLYTGLIRARVGLADLPAAWNEGLA